MKNDLLARAKRAPGFAGHFDVAVVTLIRDRRDPGRICPYNDLGEAGAGPFEYSRIEMWCTTTALGRAAMTITGA
jgi:hypothetical protein